MSGRQKWQVGYFVLLEVEAYEGEAAIVGECATGWPGEWMPPRAAVEVHGELNNKPVSAKILRSHALMVKAVE